MVTAFNSFTVGCVELSTTGAYSLLIAGVVVMIYGAYIKSKAKEG
ncbi:hypothetical protein [Nitratiruptor sp. YY09-18]|nr:hypothetical protein [Nitratiruptor sp. YY09-18]